MQKKDWIYPFLLLCMCFLMPLENTFARDQDVFLKFSSAPTADLKYQLFFSTPLRYERYPLKEWEGSVVQYLERAEKAGNQRAVQQYRIMLAALALDRGDAERTVQLGESLLQQAVSLDVPLRKKILELNDTAYKQLGLLNKQLETRIAQKDLGVAVDLHDIYAGLGLYRHALTEYIIQYKEKELSDSLLEKADYFYFKGYYLLKDGSFFTALQDLETSYGILETFEELKGEKSDPLALSTLLTLKGKVMGALGKSYIGLKNCKAAIPFLEAGLSAARQSGNPMDQQILASYWADLAQCYLEDDKLPLTKAYLDSLGNYRYKPVELRADFYRLQSSYAQRMGRMGEAIESFNRYVQLKDSSELYSLNRQMLGLLVRFDVDNQKESIIKKQREDIAKNRFEIEQREKTLFLSVVALGFCLLCVAALIVAYLKSLKNKRLIENQKYIIEKSLTEKESLLREIHHRVKNNLQMVSSLLSLQSRNTKSKAAINALEEGMSRVKAMALIHQKLYQNENLSVISMQEYIESLAASIQSVYRKEGLDVQVSIDAEKTELDVDRAIPIGLILNELVSNSFKHAFTETRKGEIQIKLHQDPGAAMPFTFEYRDNGKGMEVQEGDTPEGSMGLHLINRLANQLRSRLQYDHSGPGVHFWFSFQ